LKASTRAAVRSNNRLTLSRQISLLRDALIDSQQDKGWDFESSVSYANGYVESMLVETLLDLCTKSEFTDLVAEVTRRRIKYEAELAADRRIKYEAELAAEKVVVA
jgi:hypothetical protein